MIFTYVVPSREYASNSCAAARNSSGVLRWCTSYMSANSEILGSAFSMFSSSAVVSQPMINGRPGYAAFGCDDVIRRAHVSTKQSTKQKKSSRLPHRERIPWWVAPFPSVRNRAPCPRAYSRVAMGSWFAMGGGLFVWTGPDWFRDSNPVVRVLAACPGAAVLVPDAERLEAVRRGATCRSPLAAPGGGAAAGRVLDGVQRVLDVGLERVSADAAALVGAAASVDDQERPGTHIIGHLQ